MNLIEANYNELQINKNSDELILIEANEFIPYKRKYNSKKKKEEQKFESFTKLCD